METGDNGKQCRDGKGRGRQGVDSVERASCRSGPRVCQLLGQAMFGVSMDQKGIEDGK